MKLRFKSNSLGSLQSLLSSDILLLNVRRNLQDHLFPFRDGETELQTRAEEHPSHTTGSGLSRTGVGLDMLYCALASPGRPLSPSAPPPDRSAHTPAMGPIWLLGLPHPFFSHTLLR